MLAERRAVRRLHVAGRVHEPRGRRDERAGAGDGPARQRRADARRPRLDRGGAASGDDRCRACGSQQRPAATVRRSPRPTMGPPRWWCSSAASTASPSMRAARHSRSGRWPTAGTASRSRRPTRPATPAARATPGRSTRSRPRSRSTSRPKDPSNQASPTFEFSARGRRARRVHPRRRRRRSVRLAATARAAGRRPRTASRSARATPPATPAPHATAGRSTRSRPTSGSTRLPPTPATTRGPASPSPPSPARASTAASTASPSTRAARRRPVGPLADGRHSFEVTATDAAGNTGTARHAWTVDTDRARREARLHARRPQQRALADARVLHRGRRARRMPHRRPGGRPRALAATARAAGRRPAHVRGHGDRRRRQHRPREPHLDGRHDRARRSTIDVAPEDPSNQPSPTFEFSAEPGARVDVHARRRSPSIRAARRRPLGPLADGRHTFEVTATDAAGNSAAATYTWTVDTEAPVVTLETPPADPSNQASADVRVLGRGGRPGGVHASTASPSIPAARRNRSGRWPTARTPSR